MYEEVWQGGGAVMSEEVWQGGGAVMYEEVWLGGRAVCMSSCGTNVEMMITYSCNYFPLLFLKAL